MNEDFPSSFLHVDNHINGDPYEIPETAARASFYGVSSAPAVLFDGMAPAAVGAQPTCPAQYDWYVGNWYTPRMAATGGLSPVSIQGTYAITGDQLSISAVYRLEDPVTLTGIQATLFLTENDLYYDPTHTFHHVPRKIYNQAITLTNVGDEVAVQATVTLNPAWNPDKFEVIGILQKTSGNKEIYQAAAMPYHPDFQVSFPLPVRSVPSGNGEALFIGTVKNVGSTSDVLTLSLNSGFPWPTAFQVGDDPTWYTDPHDIPLAVGDSAELKVRVTTDDVKQIGAGQFRCQSAVSGRLGPIQLQVYNKGYSIFFVDDDGSRTDETPFINGFAELGYLYEDWNVYFDHGNNAPSASSLAGFDVVVWHTGYQGTAMGADNQTALMTYLDAGGALYLSNQDVTSTVYPPNTFAVDYLGVASRVLNTRAHTAVGVAEDPITNGMSIPLTYLSEGLNKADTVIPTATAHSIFFSEMDSSSAVANELGNGSRVVFSTIIQNAFSTSAADPNNSVSVIEKTIAWLTYQSVTDVPPQMVAPAQFTVMPNPFTRNTDLSFSLSPRASAEAVRLTVVDVSGRRVRTLVDGRLNPGMQLRRWNGADDAGRTLPSGIYFSKLQTSEGTQTQKVILTR